MSALSELVAFPPTSWRSVIPAGGVKRRTPVVPKSPRATVGAVGTATPGAAMELTLLRTAPLWSATGALGSVPP
jgi:hypothetical protein